MLRKSFFMLSDMFNGFAIRTKNIKLHWVFNDISQFFGNLALKFKG